MANGIHHQYEEVIESIVAGVMAELPKDVSSLSICREESEISTIVRRTGRDYSETTPFGSLWLAKYISSIDDGRCTIVFHLPRIVAFLKATFAHICGDRKFWHYRRHLSAMFAAGLYAHEQFHFLCDIQRKSQDFAGAPAVPFSLAEEGLATAWEWRYVRACGYQLGVPPELTANAIHYWFDDINTVGYADWKNYLHRCDFLAAFALYAPMTPPDLWLDVGQANNTGFSKAERRAISAWSTLHDMASWCRYVLVKGKWLSDLRPGEWYGDATSLPTNLVSAALSIRDDHTVSPPGSRLTCDYSNQQLEGIRSPADENYGENYLLCLADNHIQSLHNCHRIRPAPSFGKLCLRGNELTDSIAGLFLIKSLKEVSLDIDGISKIINSHLAKGDEYNRHMCMEDLGQAGYENFLEV